KPSKRLVVFCDGTWCGRETGTQSNIRILADMVGNIDFSPRPDEDPNTIATRVHPIHAFQNYVTAGYQEGIGLNKTFLEYIWDGTTASTIAEECTAVYKFIVDNFTPDHEIWIFGLSRGAYTARCVAGMINNCGIIKAPRHHPQQPSLTEHDISTLCYEVYRTYRSPLTIDHPQSSKCTEFRRNPTSVWQTPRPIKFLGLFDTVGGLGIPHLNAGTGFDWPDFYDQKVSSVVQHVYHAVCLHDRLWIFQPCLAFEGDGEVRAEVHQVWFPGCHYDVGRQTFRFVRQAPQNQIERIVGALPDRLAKTIYPNHVLADCVLRWMLESVLTHDTQNLVIPGLKNEIQALGQRIVSASSPRYLGEGGAKAGPTGSGDVYGNVLEYAPAGSVFRLLSKFGSQAVELLNHTWPNLGDNIQDLLGIKTILRILTATKDRR
ncbi:peptidoglycan binding domain-containing protein, partial [Lindgomyces ingoldianus]